MTMPATISVAALAAAAVVGVLPAKSAPRSKVETSKVLIRSMTYAPIVLKVDVAQRVVWVNNDLVPHTVTAMDGSFKSDAIAPGASWTLVPAKKGTFVYACDFHPAMSATLIVK